MHAVLYRYRFYRIVNNMRATATSCLCAEMNLFFIDTMRAYFRTYTNIISHGGIGIFRCKTRAKVHDDRCNVTIPYRYTIVIAVTDLITSRVLYRTRFRNNTCVLSE